MQFCRFAYYTIMPVNFFEEGDAEFPIINPPYVIRELKIAIYNNLYWI